MLTMKLPTMSVHAKTWWEYDQWWPETLPGPPMMDFIGEEECYVWFCFIEEGYDLLLDRCGDDQDGDNPKWLDDELEMSGWDFFQGMGSNWCWDNDFGRFAQWALEMGIAPYQPFRIWFKKPHYYRCSYEYDEWDVEWSWDVDRVIRISDWDAVRRWEHYMMERRRFITERDIERRWVAEQHRTRTDGWSIKVELYWPSGSYYCDMTPPRGLMYRLRSSFNDDYGRNHWRDLLVARSDEGSHDEAMKNLLKQVKEHFPHVHGNKIRNLRKNHW